MGQEIFIHIGVVVLGIALAYAIITNRRKNRNPVNDMIGNAAAKEQYRNPEGYDPEKYRENLQPNPDGTTPK
jgi:hypothetical protein